MIDFLASRSKRIKWSENLMKTAGKSSMEEVWHIVLLYATIVYKISSELCF